MKRLMFAGLLALGLACSARTARADCSFEYSCSRHLSYVHTSKQCSFSYNSHCNPLPCAPSCGGYGGPALWDGYHPYAAPNYGINPYGTAPYAAPVAAAPTAAPPAFTAPQPTPAQKGTASPTGLQQAGYFYYPPTGNASYGYGYGAGYNYYGAGYYQAPSYWYGD